MNIDEIKAFIKSDKFKGIISVCAAVVMYFAPEHVDEIIELILAVFGINALVIKPRNDDTDTNA